VAREVTDRGSYAGGRPPTRSRHLPSRAGRACGLRGRRERHGVRRTASSAVEQRPRPRPDRRRRLIADGDRVAPSGRHVHRRWEPGASEAARAVAHHHVGRADADRESASRATQIRHLGPVRSSSRALVIQKPPLSFVRSRITAPQAHDPPCCGRQQGLARSHQGAAAFAGGTGPIACSLWSFRETGRRPRLLRYSENSCPSRTPAARRRAARRPREARARAGSRPAR